MIVVAQDALPAPRLVSSVDTDAARAGRARPAEYADGHDAEAAPAPMDGRGYAAADVAESQRLADEGIDHYRARRYPEALQAFERAYALHPRAELRLHQATALQAIGLHEPAALRYEAYLAAAPHAADAAQVRKVADRLHAQARDAAQQAFGRAQAEVRRGRWTQAANAFAEAYGHRPLPAFLYNRAYALEMAGDTAAAVRCYRLYLGVAPGAEEAANVRAHIRALERAAGGGVAA